MHRKLDQDGQLDHSADKLDKLLRTDTLFAPEKPMLGAVITRVIHGGRDAEKDPQTRQQHIQAAVQQKAIKHRTRVSLQDSQARVSTERTI